MYKHVTQRLTKLIVYFYFSNIYVKLYENDAPNILYVVYIPISGSKLNHIGSYYQK